MQKFQVEIKFYDIWKSGEKGDSYLFVPRDVVLQARLSHSSCVVCGLCLPCLLCQLVKMLNVKVFIGLT